MMTASPHAPNYNLHGLLLRRVIEDPTALSAHSAAPRKGSSQVGTREARCASEQEPVRQPQKSKET